MGILLYSASKETGLNYPKDDTRPPVKIEFVEDAFERSAREFNEQHDSEKTFLDYVLQLYDKVGQYYHISPNDFMETPYLYNKKLNEMIDEKLERIKEGDFFSQMHLSVYLGIAKVFGAFNDAEE